MTPQNVPSGGGWLSSGVHGTVKFTLDMAIGETSRIESTDKDKVETLVQKVQDLNSRLQDVRREQVFQRVSRLSPPSRYTGGCRVRAQIYTRARVRLTHHFSKQEREAEFRDQSETTNSRVVRWTIIQLVILGVTCVWQLSHLRAFFIKQKLT